MKSQEIQLSLQYRAALKKRLTQGVRTNPAPALQLGRRAAALGLGTLELARMHAQAVATLGVPSVTTAFARRAGIFFAGANSAIEETHGAARQARADSDQLLAALDRRTAELAAANHQLRQRVARRKALEKFAAQRGQYHRKSLDKSLRLRNRLRRLTCHVLAAHEAGRKEISQALQNEVVQRLLGINLRLLSLKRQIQSDTKGLKNGIASAQRLMVNSSRVMRRTSRRIGSQ